MLTYVVRRLFFAIFVLWGALTIIFIVIRSIPGNPAEVLLGPSATPDEVAALSNRLGLQQPLPLQYALFLQHVVHGDFGTSSQFGVPAFALVLQRVPASAELAAVAMSIVLVAGFTLGPLLASIADTKLDRFATSVVFFTQALPDFWIAILLLMMFSGRLGLLPAEGKSDWHSFVLPAITLAFPFSCVLIRFVRSGILDVQRSGYIQTARAKGLSPWVIFRRHSLRNMLIPVLTIVGVQLGMLFSGAAIVETVYNWPGVGQLFLNAITYRDYSVVQVDVFLFACVFVGINFTVDILYAYIDPRIRLGRES